MSDEGQPDLNLLVRLFRQQMTEISSLRDDMNVMSPIVMRLDHTVGTLLTEVRAMHSQHGCLANRVRELEAAKDTP